MPLEPDYWHKQAPDKPLYPDMLWSRPEHRASAGKLLIIGGNSQGFAAAGEAYSEAAKAGIGTARMLLPESLRKVVGRVFEAGEYAPATPSGSFSQKALAEALAMANWSDGVLVAGDLGRNSETAILLEKLADKYPGQLTLTRDAADYFTAAPLPVLDRSETLLVISLAQLQKLAIGARFTTAFTFDMDILRFVDALHEFTALHPLHIIVRHLNNLFVASGGQISSTRLMGEPESAETPKVWRIHAAAHAATWWLQNPEKPFEALTTSLAT
jgi:hypothetical protein